MEYPRHSLTLIVKGTFSFEPESRAVPAQEPLFPTGDEFHPEDEDRESLRYESDFAWFKPRADLLLTGKCHTPEGRPVRCCPVTFQVGSKSRNLVVFGNRFWKRNAFGLWKTTDPEPFTEMELRYENSFGGRGYENNPLGKGLGAEQDQDGKKVRFLPNIEDPATPVNSPGSRPLPAGFGPRNRAWGERQSGMGTYKGKYREERWPWFPEDFDWGHCNAAPPEMQVEGYLRGDEKLYFENLHTEHSRYQSQLPGMKVRCFLNKRNESGKEATGFEEVSMHLDTLWVDMEAEKLVLVWRGWARVLSEDYDEVLDLFIMSEPLERPPASLEECRSQFLRERAAQEKSWDMEPEEPGKPQGPDAPGAQPEEVPESPSSAKARRDIDTARLQSQANALLVQMGIEPDNLPAEAREKQSRLIQKLAETDPAKVAEMEQKDLDEQMRDAFSKLGLDPDNLPPVSAKAKAEQFRFMKELGLEPADMADNPEFGKMLALMGAALPKMGLDPENLDPLIEQAKNQQERLKKRLGIGQDPETGAAKNKEVKPLTRQTVQERAAGRESFAGEILHGLDLSGLDLSNLDFSKSNMAGANLAGTSFRSSILSGADLTGAVISGADLSGADFSGADLTNADVKKSMLKDADFTASFLAGADLTGAVLVDALFEKAGMPGAVLNEAESKDANFSEADCTGCSFLGSSCPGADFSKAVLDHADFSGADLSRASVEAAVGRQINLREANLTELRASEGCDFTGGIFWNATGPGAIWENANLTGSDFRGARMEGANFTGACLKQANLEAADMRASRFLKADLQDARLVRMNLFQGSLEKADLSGADLSGSNMYGVEFLDAVVENIRAEGTNLKMSKLQEMMKRA
ncbi:MAG: DUF2169 domain-containing protein [Acidobacteria bacterium]|nr:DUF2169 domain-containing protein [Acidobacteriota bacterium]